MEKRRKPISAAKKKLRCFISAPFGCNTDPISEALAEAGVKPFRIDEIIPDRTVVDTISDGIASSDFVCAFFPRNFSSTTTFFELGAAIGARVPTLVLIESGVSVPSDLVGLLTVQVDLANPDTLRTAVRGFVASFDKPQSKSAPLRPRTERKIDSAKAVVEFRALPENEPHRFEEFIGELFRDAGFKTAVEIGPDNGVDMALWIDRLGPIMGTLVLVEVKSQRVRPNDWNEIIDRLRTYLLGAGSYCGVVITRDRLPPGVPAVTPAMPLVMTFSADEVIALLGRARFTDELITRRNLAVHGKMG